MNLLELQGVTVRYRQGGAGARELAAVDSVNFAVGEHEMLGLVGESGCGKTTLGRSILRLVPLAAGEVRWLGQRIDSLSQRSFRPLRRELQYVFQDPNACLDPRMTIAESVAEPLRALDRGSTATERTAKALLRLEEVGVAGDLARRYPHQLSGGQLQRAVIARALIVDPRFVVCDEPVSALDVTIQGQIVDLLERIRVERRLASLFISHNLAIVARLCERVMVMYRGRIVESGARRDIVNAPASSIHARTAGRRARSRRRCARATPQARSARASRRAGCATVKWLRVRCTLSACVAAVPRGAPAIASRRVPDGRLPVTALANGQAVCLRQQPADCPGIVL